MRHFVNNQQKENIMSDTKKKPEMRAYTVTGSKGKAFYHEIGAAWANSKGGYGIRLHSLPVNGEIVLFPATEKAKDEPSTEEE